MIRLILFFKKISVALLFIGLEILCFTVFFNDNPYQRAKAIASTNYVMGGLHEKISGVTNYFQLSSANDALMLENARLRSQLLVYQTNDTIKGKRTTLFVDSLPVMVARVVRNTFTARDNFITITGGTSAGIEPDMALFNASGIVGYVLYCSEHFAVATSVLNYSIFRTSGRIKGSDFKGSISWNGDDYRVVDFDEVPKYSNIAVGDTILTTESSNIFPDGLPIGTVRSFELTNGTFYKAKVTLLADLSRLSELYVVKLPMHDERRLLEEQVNVK
ncbi:MAG: rod shape-determining protein MreC [Mucinivorans sp.]